MTSQGHAYPRFRRALLTKNVLIIEAAARELDAIQLEDALRILVVLAELHDPRFDRAAAKFAARVTLERRLDPGESHRVLALATTLRDAPDAASALLRRYCG